ncbi:TonB-dependent receptor domain-containing protein [Sphingomonas psychrotolerans]|uniref:TonB-dependent receptor domain-containing protein n=1 Tax=Sphingomonas psychrotolerans TaxID=1327635 RepID=UPI0026A92ABB|nr:TonB-dependent receptor [Sphingomonas psychrotolerans]
MPPRVTDLAASINQGWEAGAKYAAGRKLEARLAYWEQSATGEVRRKLNDPAGDYDNLGATRRRGVDLQVTARPAAGIEAWGSIGWQEGKITEPDPASPESLGKQIDHVPAFLASAGFAWEPTKRWRVSLWGTAQGSYYLEKTNSTARYGDNVQFNLELSHALTDHLELEVQVKNLANRYAEYVWWDGAQTLHSPMDKRSIFAALAAKF